MKKILVCLLALCFAITSCSLPGAGESSKPMLSASPNAIVFDAEGGTESVKIVANTDYLVLYNANWLSHEQTADGLKITVEPSTQKEPRTVHIVVTDKNYTVSAAIKVTQKAYVKPINTWGWAEMPAKVENENWEYGYHHELPSNNALRNYSFCFDKEKHCSIWVAYPLHKCYIEGDGGRTDDWGYDPCCIDNTYEPDLSGSYYPQGGASSNSHSRGHHLPSADRVASYADNLTTFYCTNVTPQLQSLNGGTWMSLEDALRSNKYMCKDTLYVVTGAHFEPNVNYDYAWDSKGYGKACAVPTHYYKVVLRTKSGNSGKWVGDCSADELKCVGFWFEHKGGASRQTMSVADIEKKTGHTFFVNVPNAPKDKYNSSEW